MLISDIRLHQLKTPQDLFHQQWIRFIKRSLCLLKFGWIKGWQPFI